MKRLFSLNRVGLFAALALSFIVSVWGIRWGVPSAWAPDELTPERALKGVTRHFSDGWHDAYPPFQFYLIGAAIAPLIPTTGEEAAAADNTRTTKMFVAARSLSVLMGLGALLATYLVGARAFDHTAGVFAALILALSLPFVYYSKTANVDVPAVFWLAWSLWAYLRIWFGGGAIDYAVLGASGALAVCTKDQMFGFYTVIPIALITVTMRRHVDLPIPRRLIRALLDGRLWLGGAVAIVVVLAAYNVPFNWAGVVRHIRLSRALGASLPPVRDVDVRALLTTVGLLRWSVRWPLFILCVTGLALSLAAPKTRGVAVWLLVPSLSYYLTFLRPFGYVYDRYLLGVCLTLALFGGRLAAALVSRPGRLIGVRQAMVAAAFVYALLAAASIDWMMTVDTRYAAEQWLRDRRPPVNRIGWFGVAVYMPRFHDLPATHLRLARNGFLDDRPEYLVLNTEVLARSYQRDQTLVQQLPYLGYREVWRTRTPLPWWAVLRYDPLFSNGEDEDFTNLDNINPEMVIMRRDGE